MSEPLIQIRRYVNVLPNYLLKLKVGFHIVFGAFLKHPKITKGGVSHSVRKYVNVLQTTSLNSWWGYTLCSELYYFTPKLPPQTEVEVSHWFRSYVNVLPNYLLKLKLCFILCSELCQVGFQIVSGGMLMYSQTNSLN